MINDSCHNPCIACPPTPAGAEGFGLSPVNPNYPYLNLSAELPDRDLFIAVRPSNLGLPPLGSTWYSVGCLGFCFSETSQDDADLCASRQAALCVATQWPVMVPNPSLPTPANPDEPAFVPQTRQLYYNSPQTCEFLCPDGVASTYTVPAGQFATFNQQTSDAWAYSYACTKAAQNHLCASDIFASRSCLNQPFVGVITAVAQNLPVTASVTSGSLPDGCSFTTGPDPANPSFYVSGTPSDVGEFTFVVTFVDSFGNQIQRGYTIGIVGFTDSATLPEATEEDPYLFQLSIGGTVEGTPEFAITAGALPDGLFLNSATGEIYGTPTVAGDYSFTVTMTEVA